MVSDAAHPLTPRKTAQLAGLACMCAGLFFFFKLTQRRGGSDGAT
jgi:hypothetical protein